MVANSKALAEILRRFEKEILVDWVREQLAGGRRELMKESELREQCAEFLRLFTAAAQTSSDITAPAWGHVRDMLAGISRRKIQVGTYSLAGLLYGLAGLAQVGILSAATSSAGADDLLTPIAAAVIGGVSLFGGEGSVLGAGLGIIVIGLISDGLVLLNISTFYTQIVYGVVVFVAVLLDSGRRVLERRRA